MKAANWALGFIFLCTAIIVNAGADSLDCVVQKSALMDKLDSIDMEKQIRKRKGQSLEDLEKKSFLLKDSIAAVKKNINRTNRMPAAMPDKDRSEQFLQNLLHGNRLLPNNTFDWIVFIFAAIALIAGTILCIGLFSMVWKTVALKKKLPLKTMRENLSLRDDQASQENASQPSGMNADKSDRWINSLKKRMREESKASLGPSGTPPAETIPEVHAQGTAIKADKNKDLSETPFLSSASSSQVQQDAAADLKKLILKAALEGADKAEISKRFHVSADQVSLILRVSHQEDEK